MVSTHEFGVGWASSQMAWCGGDAVIKSAARPESHQTIQTGHYGDTSDKGSVQGEYLNNQKVFFHESNFRRSLAHKGIHEAWNYKKSFTEEEVMNFTNLRFPSPSICEYHTFEEDLSPKKKWPEPKTIIGFKMDLSTFQKAKYQENYDPISKTGQTSSTLAWIGS